jgi:hypothetical protein
MKFRQIKFAMTVGGIALLVLLSYRVFGKSIRYEIPGGFKGWLLIQWSDSSCPSLAREGLFLIVTVPQSGKFCTSSPPLVIWFIRSLSIFTRMGSASRFGGMITENPGRRFGWPVLMSG